MAISGAISTPGPAAAASRGDTLWAGQILHAGDQLVSRDRRFRLVMQGDGNAVVYAAGVALWSTNTRGAGNRISVSRRGHVSVDGAGRLKWRVGGGSQARLLMQSDGNLVLYSGNRPLWHSRTAMPNCSRVARSMPGAKMIRVSGITVHPCLRSSVARMVRDAGRSGVALRGTGWRSIRSQIALRIRNCGGETHENVWKKPASQCSPPTAKPGTSFHESGRAIDFRSSRGAINSRSKEFAWLKRNAPRYGLFNLPSEPWHWSTSGR
jgi:hypothetical protein